ncbi:biotin-dependent carboxyltransferase family protein [Nocardioides sp. CFH 31398]|uniref:5-oxoprolinase subunit C family protein n=1 Tax=Nocardioides sp. CFH 31398 TaxID=2919579 RepID=UPI001F051C9C|nr:biotin-dependent carboxyltransferase family protein [Nocardioides sp. CFH 31398]MCH1866639.1 biotin-dependent carboxyltransferase family protein [Nocardioides sp. CFH 31398]
MSALEVVATGAQAVVEDLGRPGLAGLGVAESGALDPGALRLANRLVGNPEDAAGLEVTFGGLVLRARGDVLLAVTGAPVCVTVATADGRRTHGAGAAVAVPDGAEVTLDAPAHGLRSWVAVRGGLDVARPLGSASTDLLAGLGAALGAGDVLDVGPAPADPPPALDQAPLPTPLDGTVVLRVVLGPRDDWFTAEALATLGRPWSVDARSNRVGVRLDGPPLERAPAYAEAELPSEGTVAGAVQVAANGLPVLFLADHPVTGGYPVIACVVTEDLPLAAQAVPGQQVRFRTVKGPRLP